MSKMIHIFLDSDESKMAQITNINTVDSLSDLLVQCKK